MKKDNSHENILNSKKLKTQNFQTFDDILNQEYEETIASVINAEIFPPKKDRFPLSEQDLQEIEKNPRKTLDNLGVHSSTKHTHQEYSTVNCLNEEYLKWKDDKHHKKNKRVEEDAEEVAQNYLDRSQFPLG